MKITLTKEEVEKIVLDHINSYFEDFNGFTIEGRFNRVNIDVYGYANYCVVEKIKENDGAEPGSL